MGERIYIYAWYGTRDWIGMRMTGPVAVCGSDSLTTTEMSAKFMQYYHRQVIEEFVRSEITYPYPIHTTFLVCC